MKAFCIGLPGSISTCRMPLPCPPGRAHALDGMLAKDKLHGASFNAAPGFALLSSDRATAASASTTAGRSLRWESGPIDLPPETTNPPQRVCEEARC
jgi:hypothetical protein